VGVLVRGTGGVTGLPCPEYTAKSLPVPAYSGRRGNQPAGAPAPGPGNEDYKNSRTVVPRCSRAAACTAAHSATQRRHKMLLILHRSLMRPRHLRCFSAPAVAGPSRPAAQPAQLKKPPPSRMVVVTGNHLGGTAYDAGIPGARLGRRPGPISH